MTAILSIARFILLAERHMNEDNSCLVSVLLNDTLNSLESNFCQ